MIFDDSSYTLDRSVLQLTLESQQRRKHALKPPSPSPTYLPIIQHPPFPPVIPSPSLNISLASPTHSSVIIFMIKSQFIPPRPLIHLFSFLHIPVPGYNYPVASQINVLHAIYDEQYAPYRVFPSPNRGGVFFKGKREKIECGIYDWLIE